jgi:leucyl/phenylalanyl-tRNA--protein transferase
LPAAEPVIPWIDDPAQPLPATEQALGPDSVAPGLLAATPDLSLARLREAYARGIFPWFSEGQPVLWWSPDPRMVLLASEFRLSRSLRKSIARFLGTPGCEVRVDSAFDRVIEACAGTPRQGQLGTWIVPPMVAAYRAWHRAGAVHSFETWVDDELVGGLYGVGIGRMFFGESMFSLQTDASKIALAALVAFCREYGIALIDCQQNTEHLASMGAREISRPAFERHLGVACRAAPPPRWTYDARLWARLDARFARPGAEPAPRHRT